MFSPYSRLHNYNKLKREKAFVMLIYLAHVIDQLKFCCSCNSPLMSIRRHLKDDENRKLKFNYIPNIQMRVARHTRPFYYQLEALKRVGYARLVI